MKELIALLLVACFVQRVRAETSDPYDALYDLIMIRQAKDGTFYGADSAFPLAYRDSRYLFADQKTGAFLKALDSFTALSNEEIADYGPVKRALLQRHLWTVFDWTTIRQSPWWKVEPEGIDSNRVAIQKRIASLIRRLALSKNEILALPDTLAATVASGRFPEEHNPEDHLAPFLPPGLGESRGAWIYIQRVGATITAKSHTDEAYGRSAFHVYMQLPEGRDQTLQYLKRLEDYRELWVTEKTNEEHLTTPNGGLHNAGVYVNPETPQFPAGTRFALVEQALLISDRGELVASPIAVGVQLEHGHNS